MGVHNLWKILEPVGRRVDIATLRGRILAIDASIWITQFVKAMRNAEGEALRNAHILGSLRRILKLLFYRIRPVFVFDGGTPALKRKTVMKRAARRAVHETRHAQTIRRLVLDEMQKRALAPPPQAFHAASVAAPSTVVMLDMDGEVVGAPAEDDDDDPIVVPSRRKRGRAHARTASSSGAVAPVAAVAAPRVSFVLPADVPDPEPSAGEAEASVPVLPASTTDVDLSVVMSLPPHMQKEYVEELRRQQRGESRAKLLPHAADPSTFSRAQLKGFLNIATFNSQVDKMNAEAANAASQGKRIASDASRHFLLVRDGDAILNNDAAPAAASVDGGISGDDPYTISIARIKANIMAGREADESDLDTIRAAPPGAAASTVVPDETNAADAAEEGGNDMHASAGTSDPTRAFAAAPVTELTDVQRMQLMLQQRGRSSWMQSRGGGGRGRGFRGRGGGAAASARAAVRRLTDGNKQAADVLDYVLGKSAGGGALVKQYHELSRGKDASLSDRIMGRDKAQAVDALHAVTAAAPATTIRIQQHASVDDDAVEFLDVARPVAPRAAAADAPADGSSRASAVAVDSEAGGAEEVASADSDDGDADLAQAIRMSLHQPNGTHAVIAPVDPVDTQGGIAAAEDDDELLGGFLPEGDDRMPVTAAALRPSDVLPSAWDVYGRPATSEVIPEASPAAAPADEDDWEDADAPLQRVPDAAAVDDVDDVMDETDGAAATVASQPLLANVRIVIEDDLTLPAAVTALVAAVHTAQPPAHAAAYMASLHDDKTAEHVPSSDRAAVDAQAALQEAYELAGSMRGWAKHAFARALPAVAAGVRRAQASTPVTASVADTPIVNTSIAAGGPPAVLPIKRPREDDAPVGAASDVVLLEDDDGDAAVQAADIVTISDDGSDVENEVVVLGEMQRYAQEAGRSVIDPPPEAAPAPAPLPLLTPEQTAHLRAQARADARDTDGGITESMRDDVIFLLQLFGLPYVIAPMEAEAQCAELQLAGLVDGVVTDDSDALLFGCTTLYRHIFNDGKFVEVYMVEDISRELGLHREDMIQCALLLGSDYTEGVKGVGPVNAMEILRAFPGEPGLCAFRDWLQSVEPDRALSKTALAALDAVAALQYTFKRSHKAARKTWMVPENFPSSVVMNAYRTPQVTHLDKDTHSFAFQAINSDGIVTFCEDRLDWPASKTRQEMAPVLRELAEKRTQTTLDAYVRTYYDTDRAAQIKSKRLADAVRGRTGAAADPLILAEADEPSQRRKKAKPATEASPARSNDSDSKSDVNDVVVIDGNSPPSRRIVTADDESDEDVFGGPTRKVQRGRGRGRRW